MILILKFVPSPQGHKTEKLSNFQRNNMKKKILITFGIILTILILGVWAYLFTFGAPKNTAEIFTNFGMGGDAEIVPIPESTTIDTGDSTTTGTPQALKQLTTRPVAGAVFTNEGSAIRYVEQGTGHIYSIDLTNGTETLISGTTLPGTRNAVFSKDGASVAITISDGGNLKTLVGEVGKEGGQNFTGVALPQGAVEIYFSNATNTLMYALKGTTGTTGYSYNTKKETGTQLFSIPLRDIHVLWEGDQIYVYTVPTNAQTGYMYKIVKNDLTYVTEGGRGLLGFISNNNPIVTRTDVSGVYSYYIQEKTDTPTQVVIIPEKCVGGKNLLYCSVPRDFGNTEAFPDNWYKGVTSYSDILWEIDTPVGVATPLSDFELESGRQIDVSNIGISSDDTRLYLINKNDNTLWMFDTRVLNSEA